MPNHHRTFILPGTMGQGRFSVAQVPVDRILDLRHRILRSGLPPDAARFDGDAEPATVHLAALQDDDVVGCASILRRPWTGGEIPIDAWQLRGMAVEPALHRGGVGRALMEAIHDIVDSTEGVRLLWCNARSPAVPFYQKLGWLRLGEEFQIPTAGPHYRMIREPR